MAEDRSPAASETAEFWRHALTMMVSSGAAQALVILATPVLARLYSPSDYGVYSLLLASVAVLATLAGARFELAIHLPADEEDAFGVLALALSCITLVSSAVLLASVALRWPIARLLGSEAVAPWLLALPPMVMLTATAAALAYWNKRRRQFRRVAVNSIVSRALVVGTSVGLPLLGMGGPAGLVIGNLVGLGVGASWLALQTSGETAMLRRRLTLARMRELAVRYRSFPKYLVPSSLVETFAGQLPTVLLSSFFGLNAVGLFAMANRIVALPLGVVGESVRDVFWPAASRDYGSSGDCRPIFLATLRRLAVLGALPALALLAAGPLLFRVVLGEGWRGAGEYAQILAVTSYLRFISSPLSSMLYIAERQRLDFLIQSAVLVTCVGAIAATGAFTPDPRAAVGAYAAVYGCKYVVELLLSYRLARRRPPSAASGPQAAWGDIA